MVSYHSSLSGLNTPHTAGDEGKEAEDRAAAATWALRPDKTFVPWVRPCHCLSEPAAACACSSGSAAALSAGGSSALRFSLVLPPE
jgi:hypothetical protein